MEFKPLTASDVEVRVGTSGKDASYVTLLLYKDARCDMRILDETVGVYNWQRKHYECKGNLFCSVGLNTGTEWVWKDDCGTESKTEAEKGEASDSFKRACFNWGIGRELYTSPFIYIPQQGNFETESYNGNTKIKSNDKFKVIHMVVTDKKITELTVINTKLNKIVFTMETKTKQTAPHGFPFVSADTLPLPTNPHAHLCELCGTALAGTLTLSGKPMSIASVAHASKEKFGRVLCETCRNDGIEHMSKGIGKEASEKLGDITNE